MIDELGSQARALLDAARDGMSPDAAAVRRVRGKLGGITGGAVAGAKLAIAKLMLALVGAGALVGGGWYAVRDSGRAAPARTSPAAPPVPVMPSAVPPVPSPAAVSVSQPAPLVASRPPDDELIVLEPASPPAPRRPAAAEPSRPASRRGAAAAAAPPSGGGSAGAAAPAPRSGIDLAREVELLDLAMAALRRGDASGALAAVQRHAGETAGRGQLAEDAAAIEVEALCRLHDPRAAAQRAAFDARFPRSAQRARLAAHCP